MANAVIHADIDNNRLFLAFIGRMNIYESINVNIRVLEEALKLKPGFDAVNDLTEFTPVSEEVLRVAEELMRTLKDLGLDRVVRIVNTKLSEAGSVQLGKISRKIGYPVLIAPTVDKGVQMLDDERERERWGPLYTKGSISHTYRADL